MGSIAKRSGYRKKGLVRDMSTVQKVHRVTSHAARMYANGSGITKRGSSVRKQVAKYFKKNRQPGRKLLTGHYGFKG